MPQGFWPFLIPLVFVLWWCFIIWAAARICGWSALARRYRLEGRFEGKRRHFRSGKIGWGNYNGCLTVGANSDGLFLSVMVLFRVGHPPIFIPWAELKPRIRKMWLVGEMMELNVEQTPRTKILLPGKLAKQLAADANKAWDHAAE